MARTIIQQTRTNYPDEDRMSSATAIDFDDTARCLVERIDSIRGPSRTPSLIGVGPGTIENIRRGRRKSITAVLFERIRGAAIRELEKEIRSLQAEVAIARSSGLGFESDEISSAEAALQKARKAIRNLSRSPEGE